MTKEELIEFVESLNQAQFERVEEFFTKLPKLNKVVEVDCAIPGEVRVEHHIVQSLRTHRLHIRDSRNRRRNKPIPPHNPHHTFCGV